MSTASGVHSSQQGVPRDSIEMGLQSNQELMSKQRSRSCSRRSLLLLAGLAAAGVVLIIVLAVTLSGGSGTPQPEESSDPRVGFELDDYLNGRFSYKRFNGTWVTDTQFMYRDTNGSVLLYDVFSNSSQVLLTSEEVPRLNESFLHQLSADRKYLLLGYAYEKLYRHSYFANYSVVDLATKAETILVAGDGTQRMQLVKWAPVDNALVFVHNNNIFYKTAATSVDIKPLTTTGVPDRLYHGVPDWVYEEEIFGSNEALWFSPDGLWLAYATFDDSSVRTMAFPWYGEANNFLFQYPLPVSLKYPKPGTKNPTIRLSTVDLVQASGGNAQGIQMKPPVEVGADHVLTAVTWSKNTEVLAVWMNRVQNLFVITANEAANSNPVKVLESRESGGWVEMFSPPDVSADGERLVTILPQPQGAAGNFRHLTLITRQSGGNGVQTALTTGQFVVTSVSAWDHAAGLLYFLATTEQEPAQQHLYSVKDDGTGTPTCLSCGVKLLPERQTCTHVSASFSKGQSYYTLTCNGPDVPGVMIVSKSGGTPLLWEVNSELASFMAGHSLPSRRREFVDVPGNMKAYTQLWLPPDMDLSGNTKYPMLINVYGGPDSSQISDRWVGDWGTYLTTNRSIIYGAIDGRGSGLKGNNILFSGYRRLGSVEIEDQINVTKYLQNLLPYIDKDRTAIWGWSYGGYSTGMALGKDSTGVFKCGMSVAPVTDWIYYDSIYTERYMGLPTPEDNLQGYYDANLNNHVDNLGRNLDRYLLIHGNADDNVHYQQSMILSRTLELKDILFRQQSYPDEAHGLNGVSHHLYHTLENFLDECLDLPPRK